MSPRLEFPEPPPAAKFVSSVFGLVFAGIGVTVLLFLWSGGFGHPPLFIRVFGSFIALAFVAFGGGMAYSMLVGGRRGGALWDIRPNSGPPEEQHGGGSPANVGYVCPRCGAPLAQGAEVSPHGDVKCSYCSAWFNIHGRPTN